MLNDCTSWKCAISFRFMTKLGSYFLIFCVVALVFSDMVSWSILAFVMLDVSYYLLLPLIGDTSFP